MKKILLSISVIASIAIVSCGGNTANDPKSVAKDYLTKTFALDFEGAEKLGTKNTKELIALNKTFNSMWPDSQKAEYKKVKVDVKDAKITGDNAVVTYTETDKPGDQTLKLVKQDGKWLVDQSKESVSAPADKAGAENELMAADSTIDKASDAIKGAAKEIVNEALKSK
jgi:hypothetical protein